ncbi:MAG: glycosyltransferase family 2 protein [Paludibacter sp.]
MSASLISIIVPCYNQAQYLPETLDSVLDQTYTNWECVIVNDGSPDNTEEIAKGYCNKDSRFKYLFKKNGGLSSARNAGINASLGEFILPLDSDDLIAPFYIEKAIGYFEKNPDTKLVYCKAKYFGKNTEEWRLEEYNYENLLFNNMIFCSAIYKRLDYNKTIGYNTNMIYGFEDWDFWLSLLSKNDRVYCIPEICFYYRIKGMSMAAGLGQEKWKKMTIQIYNNHTSLYENYSNQIVWAFSQIQNQQYSIDMLENKLQKIRSSSLYKIYKVLVYSFEFAKSKLMFV